MKSDQCQISPAASPEISHHTVWRELGFSSLTQIEDDKVQMLNLTTSWYWCMYSMNSDFITRCDILLSTSLFLPGSLVLLYGPSFQRSGKKWKQGQTKQHKLVCVNRWWLLHFCTLNFCKFPRGYHFSRNYKIENKKLLWCRKRTCAEICVTMKSSVTKHYGLIPNSAVKQIKNFPV